MLVAPAVRAQPYLEQPRRPAEDLFYEGSAKYSASDYEGAVSSFTEALAAAAQYGAQPSVRGALLQNLARAHVGAYRVSGDIKHLRLAIDIYERFVREAPGNKYPAADTDTPRRPGVA